MGLTNNMDNPPVYNKRLSTVVPARMTAENNKVHELTSMDLAMKFHYLRGVYFFKSEAVQGLGILELKEPMFKLLDLYYPASGRIRRPENGGRPSIKCNDSGVRICEAQSTRTLEEWMEMIKDDCSLNGHLNYNHVLGPDLGFSPLVFIQFTWFKCGGMSLGLSWAHILGDAFSVLSRAPRFCSLFFISLRHCLGPKLKMSKAGALDLASGLGGKMEKDDVLSAVDKYEKYHVAFGGEEEERKANYTDMVNKYYDLVTSFYEYGWGESFHFAPRWKGESLRESIKRHEHFLALQLGLKPGHKVLDVGCGIGGPLREIARFSSTSVTGLNNNEYQITRGKTLNRIAGVDQTCDFMKADFMKMPFPENSFDAVYAIEATCHAPDAVGCYKEIYRVLKPGQCFAAYEWCMTDSFEPNNREHQRIKAEIELGDGLPDIRLTTQCLDALKKAGFEVIWEKDLTIDSPLPWYLPLDKSHFSLSSFRLTALGRFITKNMVVALEYVGLAPKGSQRVQSFLEKAAEGLVAGGKKEIFTPMYFFLARKPFSDCQ